MSNYSKTTDFAAKDALSTGNPAKIITGTAHDTEYNNIATAVATKEDTANKNANNGYGGLDSGARLAKLNQHSSTAYLDAAANFTAGLQSSGATVLTSAYTGLLAAILAVDGAGSGIDADLLDGSSSAAFAAASHAHAATDLTSGTIPDARFPATLPAASGVNLTALNGTNVASGTVAKARIDADVYRGTLGSANISAQSGGTASGGSNGDIILIY